MELTTAETAKPVATKPVATKPVAAKPKSKAARKAKPAAKRPAAKRLATKKPAAKKAAAKKTAAATPKKAKKSAPRLSAPRLSGIPNKAEFIRQFPDLPAKEVVARAKELGAVLTESYVYNTRGLMKKGGKGRVNRLATKLAANGAYGKSHLILMDHSSKYPTPATEAKPLTVEELFYAVVAEIGTVKAVHMLMAAHDTVKRALSGVPVT